MARKPTSLTEIESAEIADIMGAVKTAALIREKGHLEEIVMHAMAELSPKDFFELLKRTRDRRAAYEALAFIGKKPPTPHDAIALPVALLEAFTDWCRGWTNLSLKEALGACIADARHALRLWTLGRQHRKYTKYDFQKLVTFIGHGNDTSVMQFALDYYGHRFTYKMGQWLRRELALRRRASAELDARRKKPRTVRYAGNIYPLKRG